MSKYHIQVLQPDACKFVSYIESQSVKKRFTVSRGSKLDERCDAVFCQTYTWREMYEQLLETDKPIILHLNGDVWYELEHIHNDLKLLSIVNSLCRKASGVICLSRFLANNGKRAVPEANITFLPKGLWGVNHTSIGVNPRRFVRKANFNTDSPVVMSQIGLSMSAKFAGIPRFFEAITEMHPRARFINVGTTRGHEELVGEWSESYGIEFVDPVKDWPSLLLQADIYVHPSLYDTWGRSIAEAMCVGLPVWSYRVGGIPELSSNIVLCDPGDDERAYDSFMELMDNSNAWPEIGNSLRKEAFDLDVEHEHDYIEILSRCLHVEV